MNDRAGQLLVSAGVLALGVAFAIGAWMLPEAAGYARVSVRLFPGLIAAGLIVAGLLLIREAAGGGFRNLAEEQRERLDWRAFAWVSAGVIAHMALIAGIGFTLASALLYAATARGFGSERPARDLGVGIVLAAVVFVLFTQGLTLSLPWGAWIPGGIS
jgi:putative tricarboxylic transport membrane protein